MLVSTAQHPCELNSTGQDDMLTPSGPFGDLAAFATAAKKFVCKKVFGQACAEASRLGRAKQCAAQAASEVCAPCYKTVTHLPLAVQGRLLHERVSVLTQLCLVLAPHVALQLDEERSVLTEHHGSWAQEKLPSRNLLHELLQDGIEAAATIIHDLLGARQFASACQARLQSTHVRAHGYTSQLPQNITK